jgi:hypothetical protein
VSLILDITKDSVKTKGAIVILFLSILKDQSMKKSLMALTSALMLASSSLHADEVSDTIKMALESYEKGQIKQASEDLNFALQLIKQQKGEYMKTLLPEPLPGWTADEATAQMAGTAMFGGGTTITRTYHKDNARISIEMVTDSPLVKSLAMMFTNPMFASADGGKVTRIGRQKAMIRYQVAQKEGEVQMMVADKTVVTLKGQEVSEEELMDYAKAIDAEKIGQVE